MSSVSELRVMRVVARPLHQPRIRNEFVPYSRVNQHKLRGAASRSALARAAWVPLSLTAPVVTPIMAPDYSFWQKDYQCLIMASGCEFINVIIDTAVSMIILNSSYYLALGLVRVIRLTAYLYPSRSPSLIAEMLASLRLMLRMMLRS